MILDEGGMVMKNFGERLKKLRRDSNTTQDSLAEYLNISYQAVSKWENAQAFPDITLIPAIANFFGVTSDYLLGIEHDNSDEKIEKILTEAKAFTHTGEPQKGISVLQDALKTYPNNHKILCNLIEFQCQTWDPDRDKKEWLDGIVKKAELILHDSDDDKIRHKVIYNLAFAYSFCGECNKATETANLLPDVAYSKLQLLSMIVPVKERGVKYKPECILNAAETLLTDILTMSKHHIFFADPADAVPICERALKIIDGLGDEGYLLFMKADAFSDLTYAYAKLGKTDEAFDYMEKAILCNFEIDTVLNNGGKEYSSPLLKGQRFDKESITLYTDETHLERYYHIMMQSRSLDCIKKDIRFNRCCEDIKKKLETYRNAGNR